MSDHRCPAPHQRHRLRGAIFRSRSGANSASFSAVSRGISGKSNSCRSPCAIANWPVANPLRCGGVTGSLNPMSIAIEKVVMNLSLSLIQPMAVYQLTGANCLLATLLLGFALQIQLSIGFTLASSFNLDLPTGLCPAGPPPPPLALSPSLFFW